MKKLFADFGKLTEIDSDEEKVALVEQIGDELKIHTELEEEIFYPAVRKAIEDSDLMEEFPRGACGRQRSCCST